MAASSGSILAPARKRKPCPTSRSWSGSSGTPRGRPGARPWPSRQPSTPRSSAGGRSTSCCSRRSSTPKDCTAMTAAPGASAPPLDELATLLRQAQAGDRRVLPALKTHMDAHPEYWVQQGNLSREIRDLLITQLSVSDLARHEAITRWYEAEFQRLAGPAGGRLRQLQR